MITSTSNGQIKKIQQLLKKSKIRREEGLFVAEGIKMFREAPADRIEKIYLSASFAEKGIWKEILKEKGISQIELAEKMGKSKQYISNILTGGKGMSISTLVEIAKILDVEFRDLFAITGNHTEINGYIKVQNDIYEIRSYEDLEKILNLRNHDQS